MIKIEIVDLQIRDREVIALEFGDSLTKKGTNSGMGQRSTCIRKTLTRHVPAYWAIRENGSVSSPSLGPW